MNPLRFPNLRNPDNRRVGRLGGVPAVPANPSPQSAHPLPGRPFLPGILALAWILTVMACGAATLKTTVTQTGGTDWTAASNGDWIKILWQTERAGKGWVLYSLSANTTGASRAGYITIGDTFFAINQKARLL